ncbi:terpene synthase metal binding domain-containing protein [Nemania sp. FL0916]|nr:terpene synthase metal binding domain-containing protein [Nemania sp. FL0916]
MQNPAAQRVTIRFPDLFKGFLVNDPLVNTGYEAIRPESENWIKNAMSLPPQQHKRVQDGDFTYFSAIMLPKAYPEKLKIVSDWGNWIFIFDDLFDEGELGWDVESSQKIVNELLPVMLPSNIDRWSDNPIIQAHDSIFRRLATTFSRDTSAEWNCIVGVLQHVKDRTTDRTITVQEMLDTRRSSAGIVAMYALIESAYELNIPDEVFNHPTIKALEDLGVECIAISNDILSYRKEEADNCPFNMVTVCRKNGSSAQKAVDEVASMLYTRFDAWEEISKSIPNWGEDIDSQVHQYIQGIQNIVQANTSWSFRSGRYFGPEAEKIRQSREFDVLSQPPYLVH